jgi:hypothetical protein
MLSSQNNNTRSANRQSFLRWGALGLGAVAGISFLPQRPAAFKDENDSPLNRGDVAILTFLSALEEVEADLWIQYAELGGATNQGLSSIDLQLNGQAIQTGLSRATLLHLEVLDGDMPQYIADNTDDEISHHRFLNNYPISKGAPPIDLSRFAVLPPSRVTGVPQTGQLTNLQNLTIDTSWWTRYRSATANPDFGGKFENGVPDLAKAPHTAIPVTDADAMLNADGSIPDRVQAIASTAGFHFAFIEQGGSSLYPAMAQKASSLETLRILLTIGGSEIMHFQTWHDKAGNAPNITVGDLIFPNLNSGIDPNTGATGAADEFQTNLIMPEPTLFLDSKLGPVSIIRPTSTQNAGAVGSIIVSFVKDGLFLDPATGKNTGIVDVLMQLAEAAENAKRTM